MAEVIVLKINLKLGEKLIKDLENISIEREIPVEVLIVEILKKAVDERKQV